MSIKYLNSKSKQFHAAASSNPKLLIVVCKAINQALMTPEAFNALQNYMDEADRQSYQVLEIGAEEAAYCGFNHIWTDLDVHNFFNSNTPAS